LLVVLRGGQQSAWGAAALATAALAILVVFVWRERHAADPILPLDLLCRPHIAAAIAGSFLIGALMFGIDTYIPLFMQGVRGGKATNAGLTLTPLFLSWSISAAVAARVVGRVGFRRTAVAGSVLIASGVSCLGLGAAYPSSCGPLFLAGLLVTGMGFGPTSMCGILGVQNAVPWERRGVATASVMFFRTMGGALGVGVLGASLSYTLGRRIGGAAGVDITAALRPETHARLAPAVLRTVQEALGRSLRDVFLEMLALAAVLIGCSLGLRGGRATSHRDAGTMHDHGPRDEALTLAAGVEH
ncbi:MAG: MFS transporter, partial [Planctomycetia bacterium]|nr:MFS transporter [Planctomycetia bacterium]